MKLNPYLLLLAALGAALGLYNAERSHCACCLKGWAVFPSANPADRSRRCWRHFRMKT